MHRWAGSPLGTDRLWQRLGCRFSLYRRAATGAAVLAVNTLTGLHNLATHCITLGNHVVMPHQALAVTNVRKADSVLPALVAVPPEVRS